MPVRKSPKIEAKIVEAIRRLQTIQGSTPREISNYIAQEYNVPGSEIRRHVQLALRRGVTYGILQCGKGGCYTYNQDFLNGQGLSAGDNTVSIRCRRGRRKVRRRRRGRSKRRSYKRRQNSKPRRSRARRSSKRTGARQRRREEVPRDGDTDVTKQPPRCGDIIREDSSRTNRSTESSEGRQN